MTRRIIVAGGTAAVLACALVPGVASAADDNGRSTSVSASQTLVKQVATNWRHEAGYPAAGTPAGHRITAASADVDVHGSSLFIEARTSLGTPAVAPLDDAGLAVQFGHRNSAGGCVGSPGAIEWSDTIASTTNHRLTGYTPSSWGSAPSTPWNCVRVLRAKVDQSTTAGFHDVLVGSLVNTYKAPKLKVGAVSVLGQKQKKLKIAKGGWTPVEVAITNAGTAGLGKVTVRGKGRGLKVRAGTLRSISDGTTHRALIRVKLAGRKKPKKLVLTARAAGGVVAQRTVKTKQIRQPKKAAPGRYKGGKGRIRFTVKKNRITQFRIQTIQRCNSYGNIGDANRATFAFPRRKIPGNGIVHSSAKGKGWKAELQLRISGKKATRATFRYYGSGGCVAAEKFSAKRTGR